MSIMGDLLKAPKIRSEEETPRTLNEFCATCLYWFRRGDTGICSLKDGGRTRFDDWCSNHTSAKRRRSPGHRYQNTD